MKVLLVCAGGMSTSIIMKKMRDYARTNDIDDFEVQATGVGSFRDVIDAFDVVLLGPQISYRFDEIAGGAGSKKPVGVIAPTDYALGNCQAIFKQVESLLKGE